MSPPNWVRSDIKKCLYYHGMAERIRWVQPPKSLLCVEIWSRFEVFGFSEKLTTFRVFGKFNRIPGTLCYHTFAIRFENGGRGCVRLAEAFCPQVPEKIVTVPKNQILFRKQFLCRFPIIPLTPIRRCGELHILGVARN